MPFPKIAVPPWWTEWTNRWSGQADRAAEGWVETADPGPEAPEVPETFRRRFDDHPLSEPAQLRGRTEDLVDLTARLGTGRFGPVLLTATPGAGMGSVLRCLPSGDRPWTIVGQADALEEEQALAAVRAFGRAAERFPRQRLLIRRVQPLAAIALWAAGIYAIVFGVFDPGREALLAIAGSAAVALGFGLQDAVRNVFGGLLVLMERPFQMGDRIRVGEAYGDVIRIGLRSVTIRTLDDSTVAIPNATFLSDRVSNTNTGALDCLVVCDTYLPARADTALAMRLAREAALSSRFLHTAKPVVVLAADHFDQQPALRIRIKAYVHDTRREMAFHTDLTRALREAYAAHGLLEER
jgi:hypothetical protein